MTTSWLRRSPSSPSSPSIKSAKKRERWLMTRKTWRYMADAGKLLFHDSARRGKDVKDLSSEELSRVEEGYQEACEREKEFIEWERVHRPPKYYLFKNREKTSTCVDYRYESLSAKFRLLLPVGANPPPGYVQVGTKVLSVRNIPNYSEGVNDEFRLSSGIILEQNSTAKSLAERDWSARRCSSDSGVLSPEIGDFEENGRIGCRGSSGIASAPNSLRCHFRHKGIQTEALPPEFYELQDAEKETKIREAEEKNRREEEEKKAKEKALKEVEEKEGSHLGDSVLRYLKMVQRNSKNSDVKKAERFRSMNYDPTLRNIKAKYLHKDVEIDDDDEENNENGKSRSVEIQAGESLIHLLKMCHGSVKSSERKWSQSLSDVSESSIPELSSPSRRYSDEDRDFFSHLYSGELSALDSGSVPEDYYQYLETWYEAQKAISIPSSRLLPPPPSHSSSSTSTVSPGVPLTSWQSLRSSLPTLTSSQSTTSLSGSSSAIKNNSYSLLSTVLGSSTKSISRKLWNPRSKSQGSITSSSLVSQWICLGDNRWSHTSLKEITLEDTNLLLLHELERVALQKLAAQIINASDLGVGTVRIPKDTGESSKTKRKSILRRRGGVPSRKKERDKEKSGCSPVFGIPIGQCTPLSGITRSNSSKTSTGIEPVSCEEDVFSSSASRSNSQASFRGSLSDPFKKMDQLERQVSSSLHLSGSSESLNHLEFPHLNQLPGATDNLSLTSAAEDLVPTVPKIVMVCIRHIEQYGLRTLGIFRVSSSMKRVKQLRKEFDNGAEMSFSDETSVHDVATILKEFFRDLPEPLIPNELTSALLAIQKIRDVKNRLQHLQRLIQILPLPNRDTLFLLLQFLGLVSENAEDKIQENGEILPGNKMDSTNLATLFAPNLLHFKVDEVLRSDKHSESISAIQILIEMREAVFELPVEQLNDLYLYLLEYFPELLDALLHRRIICGGRDENYFDEINSLGDKNEDVGDNSKTIPTSISERGRERKRKTSEDSTPGITSSSWLKLKESSENFSKWTFQIIRKDSEHKSRAFIKIPSCSQRDSSALSPTSSSNDCVFFGSGTSSPSLAQSPTGHIIGDTTSPRSYSPPFSPTHFSPHASAHLILKPVPPSKKASSSELSHIEEPSPSSLTPTILEEETPTISSFKTSSTMPSCALTTVTAAIAASRLSKIPSSFSGEGRLSESKEHKRYNRRRYIVSKHPTTELPEVPSEPLYTLQRPPIKRGQQIRLQKECDSSR